MAVTFFWRKSLRMVAYAIEFTITRYIYSTRNIRFERQFSKDILIFAHSSFLVILSKNSHNHSESISINTLIFKSTLSKIYNLSPNANLNLKNCQGTSLVCFNLHFPIKADRQVSTRSARLWIFNF